MSESREQAPRFAPGPGRATIQPCRSPGTRSSSSHLLSWRFAYCNGQLAAFVEHRRLLSELGADVVAISVD